MPNIATGAFFVAVTITVVERAHHHIRELERELHGPIFKLDLYEPINEISPDGSEEIKKLRG